jgi:hypothetical protein
MSVLAAVGTDGRQIPAQLPQPAAVLDTLVATEAAADTTAELKTEAVIVQSDEEVYVRFSKTGEAATSANSIRLLADEIYVFPIDSGDRISALRVTAGTANVRIVAARLVL